MTLTKSLILPITSSLTQSLTGAAVQELLEVPITADLIVHTAAFQDGKTKAELVNVDGGDLVEDWFGITSTAFDASQLTGSRQPLYTASAINAHPAIDFDGSDDLLNFGFVFNPTTTGVFTIFVVLELNTNSSTKTILSQVAVGESFLNTNSDTSWRTTIGSGNLTTAFSTNPTILTLKLSGGTLGVYVDGDLKTSAARTPSSLTTDLLIGARSTTGANPVNGFIGEILVYDAGLSTGDQDEVEDYLSEKWDITLT